MDDQTTPEADSRGLDAMAANRLAQEINDAAQGTELTQKFDDAVRSPAPVSAEGQATTVDAPGLRGDNPVESQEVERQSHLFPPNIHPTSDLGGSPEDQRALAEEYGGR